MPNFVVGLTGGIGSGKSTVAKLFADFAVEVVDADVVSRQVVAKGTSGLEQIIEHFGASMLLANGELDRVALRDKIFNQSKEREWLDNLLHPMIRKQIVAQLEKTSSVYAILMAPLLFENDLDKRVNRTLMVNSLIKHQIQRTMRRDGTSAEQVQRIIAVQAKRDYKLSKADDIIENDGDIAALKEMVTTLHHKYLQLSSL